MASGNQASDGKGQGPGYQIGELDLGSKPKRSSSAELPAVGADGRASGMQGSQGHPSRPQSQTNVPAVGAQPARPAQAGTAIGYALADAAQQATQRAQQPAGAPLTPAQHIAQIQAQQAAQLRAAQGGQPGTTSPHQVAQLQAQQLAQFQAQQAAQAQAQQARALAAAQAQQAAQAQARAAQLAQLQGQPAPQVRGSETGLAPVDPAAEIARIRAASQAQLAPVQAAPLAAAPANQQQKAEKGLGRHTFAAEDDGQSPALELEIDLDALRGKKGAPAQAQAKAAAAKPAPSALEAFDGGKDFGDGFGEPESGPALELEHVDRKSSEGRVSTKGPDPKLDLAKEEAQARELAGFGDEPENLGEAVRYAIHVARRLLVLKREREKAQQDAGGLEADYDTALAEMGQALMAMATDPKVQPLRSRIAAVHDANAKVTSAEQSMSRAKEENIQALSQLEREANDMRASLQPFIDAEQAADRAHKKTEEETRRADGLVKRVEIEIRAATEAKADPARLEAVRAQLEERKAAHAECLAREQQAAQALGQARKELAMRRGALDALDDKKKSLAEEHKKKEAAVEQTAKQAEGTHAGALRALAQYAIEQKLEGLVEDRYEWVKEVEKAYGEARKVVVRYDRALTLYERPAVIKGFAVMGGLALLLILAIALALGG